MEKQKSYRRAFEVARQEIQSRDPAYMAACSGAEYRVRQGKEEIVLSFFGDPHTVTFPEIEIFSPRTDKISLVTRIMLLHYLIRADGTELEGTLIPYKEIPGGRMYAGVFDKRVTEGLIRVFGQKPGDFLRAGLAMGGNQADFGDASFSLVILPRVPVTLVLWRGDEEFPPSVQVLFDRSIDRYLSLEDVVVLGEMTSKRLIARSSTTR
ncbi:MAG: DUF3786 domain-containing protein [Deltaproteobacteria bacterium]|nr:DUF3786 domain-containing protein [Deltaproteobacteria bacterium]